MKGLFVFEGLRFYPPEVDPLSEHSRRLIVDTVSHLLNSEVPRQPVPLPNGSGIQSPDCSAQGKWTDVEAVYASAIALAMGREPQEFEI